MNIWVISALRLLWKCCLSIHVQYLFKYVISVLFGIYLGVELLGHLVILCLTFGGPTKLFSTAAEPFYVPASTYLCLYIFISFNFSLRLHLLSEIPWPPCLVLWPAPVPTLALSSFFSPFTLLAYFPNVVSFLGTCSNVSLYLVLPLTHRNSYSSLSHRSCSPQQSIRHLSFTARVYIVSLRKTVFRVLIKTWCSVVGNPALSSVE